jgi:DNA-binding protein YbaB
MHASPDHGLEQLLADFAERYEAVVRARAQLESLAVTAQSRDGVVEATIDINGTVLTVRFVDKRFRSMPDSELAKDVLDALATAQAEAVLRIDVLRAWAEALPPTVESRWMGSGSSTRAATSRTEQGPGMIGSPLGSGPSALQPPEACCERMGTGSSPGIAPLPTDLRDAVISLGNAICVATDCFCLTPASEDSNWFDGVPDSSSHGPSITI